jgi:hypothetical protein
MANREKEVGLRLSVKDKEIVERALKGLGKDGQEALERIGKAADKSAVSLQALDAAANVTNRGMQKLKAGVALTAAALATGFAVGIKGAIDRLEEMDRMSAQVDLALSNTGNTAKTSAAELADFADQLEIRTGRAAEEIMAIGGNLATFKFDHEVFYRSIELANDMSAAWGGELRQNLEGLSRALADPEKGFAMLEKRGISLTDVQGDMVKRFMAVNDLASAQRVILDALEADVKGVAERGMTPLQKATLTAQKALEDMFEDLVRGEEGSEDLRVSIERAAATLSDPRVLASIRMFGTVLITVLREALEFAGGVAAGIQRVIDMFHALEGQSDASLEQKRFEINTEIVRINNERTKLESDLGRFTGASPSRDMLQMQVNEAVAREAELRAEEAQIRAILDARKPAQPAPTPANPSISPASDLPPPVLTKDQEREQARALKEAERLTEQMRTASEAYAASLADLDAMLSRGLITQETYNRATAAAALEFAGAANTAEEYRLAQDALADALAAGLLTERQYTEAVEELTQRRLSASNDWITGLERGLDRLGREGRNFGGDIEDTLVSAASGFEDALVEAFRSGKFEWDDLQSQIMSDVLRMGIRQGIGGLGSLASGLFSGFSGGGSGLRLGFQAGVGHDGAIMGSSAVSRMVAPEIFAGAQRHHAGTDFLKPGEVPFIGMRGEEIGWPSDLRRKYGGRSEVTVEHRTEIHNYSGEPVREERTKDADGVDVSRFIIGEVTRGIVGGRFDTALTNSFGLRRKAP